MLLSFFSLFSFVCFFFSQEHKDIEPVMVLPQGSILSSDGKTVLDAKSGKVIGSMHEADNNNINSNSSNSTSTTNKINESTNQEDLGRMSPFSLFLFVLLLISISSFYSLSFVPFPLSSSSSFS
jgi:hypothetical protein